MSHLALNGVRTPGLGPKSRREVAHMLSAGVPRLKIEARLDRSAPVEYLPGRQIEVAVLIFEAGHAMPGRNRRGAVRIEVTARVRCFGLVHLVNHG